jgi:hypothetical protein
MGSARKTILLPTNKGRVEALRATGLKGRANSHNSQKHSRVTLAKRRQAAKRQRKYRLRHPKEHAAQQRAYRRRKRQAQQEADAVAATARPAREDQERQERAAEANKVSRELESRSCAVERLATAAGVSIERWLGSLPSEEAAKYTDLRARLIERERLDKEVAQRWEQLGYDRFTGLPLRRSQIQQNSPAREEERALTLEEAWAARVRATEWERVRAREELQNRILANGIIL